MSDRIRQPSRSTPDPTTTSHNLLDLPDSPLLLIAQNLCCKNLNRLLANRRLAWLLSTCMYLRQYCCKKGQMRIPRRDTPLGSRVSREVPRTKLVRPGSRHQYADDLGARYAAPASRKHGYEVRRNRENNRIAIGEPCGSQHQGCLSNNGTG